MKKTVKTILILFLILTMVFALCACSIPAVQVQNEDGSLTVVGLVIETGVNLCYRLVWAATAAFAAWVLKKIGENIKLKNVALAISTVCEITRQTAEELQQTIVGDLKANRPGGKLTPEEIDDLGFRLLNIVKNKLDAATQEIVIASGADLDALITGECEAFLNRLKSYTIPAIVPVSGSDEEQEQDEE